MFERTCGPVAGEASPMAALAATNCRTGESTRAVLTVDTAAIEQCHQYAVDKRPYGGSVGGLVGKMWTARLHASTGPNCGADAICRRRRRWLGQSLGEGEC